MKISIGSDPELHLFNKDEGRVVSSLRVLKRDKHNPIELGDGIRMYADNVLTEAAMPPASDVDGIIGTLRTVWTRIQEQLGSRFHLVPKAAHVYPKSELRGRKPWETGCNPNFDAYAKSINAPANFTDGLRTGSFHIHIGHPMVAGRDAAPKIALVKLMDVFLGCASVIYDRDETAPLRRALYGRAGEYRDPPYGVEYRVLGNYSLACPELTRLAFDLALHAVHRLENKEAAPILSEMGNDVQLAINGNDKRLAFKVLDRAALPGALMQRVVANYPIVPFNKAWGI